MKIFKVKNPLGDYFNTLFSMKKRLDIIGNGSDSPVKREFNTNKLAKSLHPDNQELIVTDIKTLNENTKQFTFRRPDNLPTAYFRAGQYIALTFNIGQSVVTRPFSLSSSPADSLRGDYCITVTRRANGYASSYILDNFTVGTKVNTSAPEGKFFYEPLRDAENVLCIASPDGIGAVLSLAKAVSDGTEKAFLSVICACENSRQAVYREEFEKLQKVSGSRVKVSYYLSEEKIKGFQYGDIDCKIIKRFMPKDKPCSVFISSHNDLYYKLKAETDKLSIQKKFIRFEDFGELDTNNVISLIGEDNICSTYTCTLYYRDEPVLVFDCKSNSTLLSSIEAAGITVPNHCRSGECGFCRLKLISGDVVIPQDSDLRRIADKKFGYIHPCITYPVSDVVLKL